MNGLFIPENLPKSLTSIPRILKGREKEGQPIFTDALHFGQNKAFCAFSTPNTYPLTFIIPTTESVELELKGTEPCVFLTYEQGVVANLSGSFACPYFCA